MVWLTIWYWTTSCLLFFLWERLFVLLSHSLLSVVVYVGYRPHVFSIIHGDMSIVVVIVHLTFGKSCWWDVMGLRSDIIRRHNPTANFLILCLLRSFGFLFFFFWNITSKSLFKRIITIIIYMVYIIIIYDDNVGFLFHSVPWELGVEMFSRFIKLELGSIILHFD